MSWFRSFHSWAISHVFLSNFRSASARCNGQLFARSLFSTNAWHPVALGRPIVLVITCH